jgi:hypothetical protein
VAGYLLELLEKVVTAMIKKYNCSNCSQSFEKYVAPFEKFNTVECFLCKGRARVEPSPSIQLQFTDELFLRFNKYSMTGVFDLANK